MHIALGRGEGQDVGRLLDEADRLVIQALVEVKMGVAGGEGGRAGGFWGVGLGIRGLEVVGRRLGGVRELRVGGAEATGLGGGRAGGGTVAGPGGLGLGGGGDVGGGGVVD